MKIPHRETNKPPNPYKETLEEVATLLRGEDVNDITQFKRQGLSISQIQSLTGYDRKTIRKYLEEPHLPQYGPRTKSPPRKSLLAPHQPYIEERLKAGVWNAVVLHRELRERGYLGGYTLIKDFLRPRRQEANRVATRRFETPPGQQAQVDWGILGEVLLPDETRKTLSGFVMTLGYSRAMFAEAAWDQKMETFLRMHERAFEYLGGVPQEILYDNQKTVIVRTMVEGLDERGELRLNRVFADFAHYWGFEPRLCRPYRAQTKGKVENGIGYIRKNFLCGCRAEDFPDFQSQMRVWVGEIANRRLHGTTHRYVGEMWEEEKPSLCSGGRRPPYPFVSQEVRRVARDAFVSFRTNRYSVPWQAAGKEVYVRLVHGQVEILRENEPLARHRLCLERYRVILVPAHHAGMPFGSSRSRGKVRVSLRGSAPQVQVRSLQTYEALVTYEVPVGAASLDGDYSACLGGQA